MIDLALLFKLVNRVPNATNELKKIVEHHIYEMGINTIERVSGTAINVSLRHLPKLVLAEFHEL